MEWSPSLVRAARESAALSQREVAERAGVSIDTVRRAETGTHEPGANALGGIAAALGVSIASLYVHEPEASTAPPATAGESPVPAETTEAPAPDPADVSRVDGAVAGAR